MAMLAIGLSVGSLGITAQATEGWREPIQETMGAEDFLADYDFSELQELLDAQAGEAQLDFSDLVQTLIGGDVKTFASRLAQYVGQALNNELAGSRAGLWQILLLATVGALFARVTAVFEQEGVSEISFFVTYLLLASVLLTSFALAAEIAAGLVGVLLHFMGALLPAFFLAVAFGGRGFTALAFHEVLVVVIAVVEWLMAQLVLPFIRVYVIAAVINHLTKEELFAKTTELIGSLVRWGLNMMLSLVTGYSLVQSLILPQVDAVQAGAVTKLVSALPGIGGSVSAFTSLVLGSGALIRNGIGTAALIALVFLSAVPLCKLALIYLMYAAVQALIEPISDKRVVGCVAGVADGVKLLLKMTFTALLLFLILIAIICACGAR